MTTMAANGMAVARGVQQFALGSAFSNKVFNQPTMFRFGNGGANLGIMGEAGDEAVMPLRRGPVGRLGVSLWGGARGGAGSRPVVHQSVTYHVSAGVSPAMLAAAMDLNNQRTKGELAAVRLHERSIGLQRQVEAAREQQSAADARAVRVERELGTWGSDHGRAPRLHRNAPSLQAVWCLAFPKPSRRR